MSYDDPMPPHTFEDVYIKHTTDKAALVEFNDGEEMWIPLSVVDDYDVVRGEAMESLTVEGWWWEANG